MRTKQGCKSGRKHRRSVRQDNRQENRATSLQSNKGNEAVLPSLLYTNCRSLNEWKLSELAVLTEIHNPQIVCLTETWLTADKEKSHQLEGFQNFFCHCSDRNGGGVAILAAKDILLRSYHHTPPKPTLPCGLYLT